MEPSTRLVLDFPIYGMSAIGNDLFAIAGGGGRMKSGIPNRVIVKAFRESSASFESPSESSSIETSDAHVAIAACPSSQIVYTLVGTGCKNFVFERNTSSFEPESSFEHDIRIAARQEQSAIAISADASLLAVASESGGVLTLKLPDYTKCTLFKMHGKGVDDVALSEDGVIAASTSARDKTSFLWSARSGRVIQLMQPVHRDDFKTHMRCLRFCPGNPSLLFTGESNPRHGAWVTVWRAAVPSNGPEDDSFPRSATRTAGKEDRSDSLDESAAGFRPVACAKVTCDALTTMAVYKDGRVAVASSEGHVALLKWNGKSQLRTLWSTETRVDWFRAPNPPHVLPITSMAFTDQGKFLLTASADFTVAAWPARRTGVRKSAFKVMNRVFVFLIVLIAILLAEESELPIVVVRQRARLEQFEPRMRDARGLLRPYVDNASHAVGSQVQSALRIASKYVYEATDVQGTRSDDSKDSSIVDMAASDGVGGAEPVTNADTPSKVVKSATPPCGSPGGDDRVGGPPGDDKSCGPSNTEEVELDMKRLGSGEQHDSDMPSFGSEFGATEPGTTTGDSKSSFVLGDAKYEIGESGRASDDPSARDVAPPMPIMGVEEREHTNDTGAEVPGVDIERRSIGAHAPGDRPTGRSTTSAASVRFGRSGAPNDGAQHKDAFETVMRDLIKRDVPLLTTKGAAGISTTGEDPVMDVGSEGNDARVDSIDGSSTVDSDRPGRDGHNLTSGVSEGSAFGMATCEVLRKGKLFLSAELQCGAAEGSFVPASRVFGEEDPGGTVWKSSAKSVHDAGGRGDGYQGNNLRQALEIGLDAHDSAHEGELEMRIEVSKDTSAFPVAPDNPHGVDGFTKEDAALCTISSLYDAAGQENRRDKHVCLRETRDDFVASRVTERGWAARSDKPTEQSSSLSEVVYTSAEVRSPGTVMEFPEQESRMDAPVCLRGNKNELAASFFMEGAAAVSGRPTEQPFGLPEVVDSRSQARGFGFMSDERGENPALRREPKEDLQGEHISSVVNRGAASSQSDGTGITSTVGTKSDFLDGLLVGMPTSPSDLGFKEGETASRSSDLKTPYDAPDGSEREDGGEVIHSGMDQLRHALDGVGPDFVTEAPSVAAEAQVLESKDISVDSRTSPEVAVEVADLESRPTFEMDTVTVSGQAGDSEPANRSV